MIWVDTYPKPPLPGTLRTSPATNQVAYAAEESGVVVLTFDDELPVVETELDAQPANSLAWSGDGRHLVFLDRTGRLYRVPIKGSFPEPLLELGYSVHTALVAEDGTHVAWMDPSGRLRATAVDDPVQRHVQVTGEVVAFDWQGSHALICLVAKPNSATTMRYHAEYELWRVPTETLEGEAMPIKLGLE